MAAVVQHLLGDGDGLLEYLSAQKQEQARKWHTDAAAALNERGLMHGDVPRRPRLDREAPAPEGGAKALDLRAT